MSASIDIENELMVKDKNGNTHKHTQTDIDIYHMFMNSCQLQINCRELFYNIYILMSMVKRLDSLRIRNHLLLVDLNPPNHFTNQHSSYLLFPGFDNDILQYQLQSL